MKLATNTLGTMLLISFFSGVWISILSVFFGYSWLEPLKIALVALLAWIVLVGLTFLFDLIEDYTRG